MSQTNIQLPQAMTREEALALKAELAEKEKVSYKVCTTGQEFQLTKDMVAISEKVEKSHGRNFTPSVIEPSFGIGRIMYCLYEHSFYTRPAVSGEQVTSVFRFPPIVPPIKCSLPAYTARGSQCQIQGNVKWAHQGRRIQQVGHYRQVYWETICKNR
jgi:glycyl-tRNA synthetase (class II)